MARSLRRRRHHPVQQQSWRWWVSGQPAWLLLLALFGGLAVLSLALAGAHVLVTHGGRRFDSARAFLSLTASMFRALSGSGDYPDRRAGSLDDLLASFAAAVGLVLPALVIAVVFARMYSIRGFVWREQASVCLPWEVDESAYRQEKEGTHHGTLAVRFYKQLRHLTIADLRCEAYLRYLEPSPVDGSRLIRSHPLKVLGPNGSRVDARLWPVSKEGTTFTLWIPMDAELDGGQIRTVQGIDISDSGLHDLLIRVSGKVGGLGVEVHDEHWYRLDPQHVQIGRFARVDVDLTRPSSTWAGWDHFEEPARQALFVYGRLVDPQALRDLYGHVPRPGAEVVRARIRGFRRTWSVATDNADAQRAIVYRRSGEPEVPEVKVLFLNLEGAPAQYTEGLLLKVSSDTIAQLNSPDGNFTVEDVTGLVEYDKPFDDGPPDIVHTYLGRPGPRQAARSGLADGTAVISEEFLTEVQRGMASYDLALRTAFEAEPLPPVPVEQLVRTLRDPGRSIGASRIPEQG
jgi:hypothetical protein